MQKVDLCYQNDPQHKSYVWTTRSSYRSSFLPELVGNHSFCDVDREIYSLPTRFEGLAIFNPVEMAKLEFKNPETATQKPTVTEEEAEFRWLSR